MFSVHRVLLAPVNLWCCGWCFMHTGSAWRHDTCCAAVFLSQCQLARSPLWAIERRQTLHKSVFNAICVVALYDEMPTRIPFAFYKDSTHFLRETNQTSWFKARSWAFAWTLAALPVIRALSIHIHALINKHFASASFMRMRGAFVRAMRRYIIHNAYGSCMSRVWVVYEASKCFIWLNHSWEVLNK